MKLNAIGATKKPYYTVTAVTITKKPVLQRPKKP